MDGADDGVPLGIADNVGAADKVGSAVGLVDNDGLDEGC